MVDNHVGPLVVLAILMHIYGVLDKAVHFTGLELVQKAPR